jgi:hypothetical protein
MTTIDRGLAVLLVVANRVLWPLDQIDSSSTYLTTSCARSPGGGKMPTFDWMGYL